MKMNPRFPQTVLQVSNWLPIRHATFLPFPITSNIRNQLVSKKVVEKLVSYYLFSISKENYEMVTLH